MKITALLAGAAAIGLLASPPAALARDDASESLVLGGAIAIAATMIRKAMTSLQLRLFGTTGAVGDSTVTAAAGSISGSPPEQAGRPNQQHDHHDQVRDENVELGREIDRDRAAEADHQGRDRSPFDAAEAGGGGYGEGEDDHAGADTRG